MNIQSPEILSDLYRDLRDRRLLPLIILLVAAMVVVPVALSKSPKSAAPVATPQVAAPAHGSALTTAHVTILDPGVRDYRRRLHGDAAKDPFVQLFGGGGATSAATSAAAGAPSSTGNSTSAGLTSTSGGSAPLTIEGQAASDAANGTSPSTGVTGGGSSSAPSSGTRQSSPQSTKIVFYRLKVRSGPVGGEMKVNDEVGPSTALPSKTVPALAFLGVTFDGNLNAQQAYFLVSNGVSLVTGSGDCSFGAPCQLVAMKPGDYTDLTWTDGQQYRIKLLAFERHTRDDPGNSGALTSSPKTQTGAGSGQSPTGRKAGHKQASHHFSF
jgi:hypothetical protein